MARKVFLSFLGASFYSDTIYYIGESSYKTKYIQEATLKLLNVDWQRSDAIRIFVTEQAEKDNWTKELGTRENRNKEIVAYKRLEQTIGDMHLDADVKAVQVPEGKNENEIWQIFKIMFDEVNEGDELYIDLTHGFRYLPMLMLVFADYAKFLKKTTVESITYGNYEARDKETNRAPIVNLVSLATLQDWTTAASDFINYGNADGLKNAIKEKLSPLLRNASTRTDNVQNVNKLGACLEAYTDERITCRGLKVVSGDATENLYNRLADIKDTGIAPLNPIFEHLKENVTVPETAPARCYEAAVWCYGKQLYQQAITLLQEGINTFFCLRHGIEISDEKARVVVGNAFHIKYDEYEQKHKNKGKASDNSSAEIYAKGKLKELLNDPLLNDEGIVSKYSDMGNTRNDYNHAGFRKTREPLKPKKIKTKISEALDYFRELLQNAELLNFNASDTLSSESQKAPVFLNLSNHPSAEWEKKQIEAARKYGEVVDEQFPQVNPEDSIDDIKNLAEKTAGALVERYGNEALTVHVMGEMTLTCELVRLLKGAGVRCLASCTQRNVEDKGNGDKVSHFKFVQFREY